MYINYPQGAQYPLISKNIQSSDDSDSAVLSTEEGRKSMSDFQLESMFTSKNRNLCISFKNCKTATKQSTVNQPIQLSVKMLNNRNTEEFSF